MSARWNSSDLPKKKPATPRTAPTQGKTPPTEREGPTPAFEATPAGPRTYLVGPYALSVGGTLHSQQLPDRLRIVITGPACEELPAALVAALEAYVAGRM